jgi:hypothetical protein
MVGEKAMNTHDVAHAFTAMLKEGRFEEAGEQFWDVGVVSIEAMGMPGMDPVTAGVEALKAKGDWWYANNEIHAITTEGPFIHGDQFAVRFDMDVTNKATGERGGGAEIGLYTVKDGKIVEERFFYAM